MMMLSALSAFQPPIARQPVFTGSPFPGRKAGLTIDEARLKDVPEFIEFTSSVRAAEYGAPLTPEEKKHRSEWLISNIRNGRNGKAPANHIYTARDGNGRIVATTMFHQFPVKPDTAYLGMSYIAEEYRNSGIAYWFLKQCIDRGRRYGLSTLKMEGRLATIIIAAKQGVVIDVEEADKQRAYDRQHYPQKLKEMPVAIPMKLDLRA